VAATAEIMAYMAGATAAQCGPCVFGLAAIAQAVRRLADGTAPDYDLERIDGWAAQVEGRGACHHPDGAIALLRSALRVFADDFARHQSRRPCPAARRRVA
jgi:NADH:ubiquinone oxidoreductase subunit F (NADH-binding)